MKKVILVLFIFSMSFNKIYCQGNDKPYSLENELKNAEESRMNGLVKMSDSAINKIIERINNAKTPQEKAGNILLLSNVASEKQIPCIENVLITDTNQNVLIAACRSLVGLNSKRSIPAMVSISKKLSDENKIFLANYLSLLQETQESFTIIKNIKNIKQKKIIAIRGFIRALGNIAFYGNNEAIDSLKVFLYCDIKSAEAFSALVLAQLHENDIAYSKLSELINDPDPLIRVESICGLAYIGDEKSLALISEKLNDPDIKVRDKATLILKNLNK